jgi:DNA-binding IclR family transcriptional regulator
VFDAEGRAIGAVGIVGPVERLLTADRLEGLAEAVRLTGQALSQYTGHATESGMWATYGIQG